MPFGRQKRKQLHPVRPYCGAVVPAAGLAARMAGLDKIFCELDGTPLIIYTLFSLQNCPDIDEIVVAARPGDIIPLSRLCRQYDLGKIRHIVRGGDSRVQSVLNGLMALSQEAELAAIHDAARPLVLPRLVSDVVRLAARTGAAALAVPPKDTIKRVSGARVEATLPRDALRLAQTPQVFNTGLIKGALTRALQENWEITDDCGAVERMGMTVCLAEGSYENLKVTTPEDLLLARAIMEKHHENRTWV